MKSSSESLFPLVVGVDVDGAVWDLNESQWSVLSFVN